MVDTSKLVSVIIPVYNVEKYLAACLDSVLTQSYSNLEVIVVNDGSTDGSGSICDKYAQVDTRIKYVEQDNSGVSAARNNAMAMAQGEYVTFVDSDDILLPNAIEQMYSLMKSRNVDCVRTRCNVKRPDGTTKELADGVVLGVYRQGDIQELMFRAATGRLMCFVWLLMIKRSIIQKNNIQFPVDILMMEDMYFYIQLLQNVKSVLICDTATYDYYVRDAGATRSANNFDKKLNSIARIDQFLSEQGFSEREVQKIHSVNAGNMVNYTVINAMQASGIADKMKLINNICANNAFSGIYDKSSKADMSKYYKLVCWAARNRRMMVLLTVVVVRKAIGR